MAIVLQKLVQINKIFEEKLIIAMIKNQYS